MAKTLSLTLLLSLAVLLPAGAQCLRSVGACHGSGIPPASSRHSIEAALAYGYNTTERSYGSIGLTYSGMAARWARLSAGAWASTSDSYALKLRADFSWQAGRRGRIGLRNHYLYSAYAYASMQGFDAALMAVYDHDYFYAGIGAVTRLFAPLRGGGLICEPVDMAYDIEGRIFPKSHPWNIALQITNLQPFRTGRFYEPELILTGNCRVYEGRAGRYSAPLRAAYRPAGLLSIATSFYGIEITAGVISGI